ncbi:helix-turn-helix domain-containing protein [Nocardia terpenica]|uniref:Helix-turn-helix domain-containing protein n=1 Tax=Nocardia terpenica TaxID=455432 RepID=A0A6G9ZDH7_9NOCA|nr:helix-turn-helix domain-containing protein [Nocardia terpenica]QIS23451.1 helix-turn-helix domain-containing protein [Nocardia terpenica]
MPKLLCARPAADAVEEAKIRKLARARHAPADWVLRARIIECSWQGMRVPAIAGKLGCHEKTVRQWIVRFNTDGVGGLSDRPGCGRKRRITEAERSRIIGLVKTTPAGRLEPGGEGLAAADEHGPAYWTLDALTETARAEGIDVGRSQVRRILLAEGVRWRRTRSWMTSADPDFVPKGRGSSGSTPTRRTTPRLSAPTSWAQ